MSVFPEFAVHKTVPLKFSGVELRLKTSHALFSSRHVDDGTMLLLKTLAQTGSVPAKGRVLDVGCGYGPLAVALKKFRPELQVTARDRLALAVAFTAENARLNGVTVDAEAGLLLEEVPGPWDLVVSNVPAKTGEPVLIDFVPRSLALLAPGGLAAVVLIEPLAAWFSQELDKCGAEQIYQESGKGYRVFHYRSGTVPAKGSPEGAAFPEVYRRSEVRWSVGPRNFLQKTFYGLPNFDALDYRLQVTQPLLDDMKLKGDCLVWEPVQGHLSTWADSVLPPETALHLAGNDLLGLLASAQNVVKRSALLHPAAFFSDLELGPGSIGSALLQVFPEPEIKWVDDTREALLRLLAPGAQVLLNGSSTDLTRFLERHRGLRKLRDERSKGWRAVLMERTLAIT